MLLPVYHTTVSSGACNYNMDAFIHSRREQQFIFNNVKLFPFLNHFILYLRTNTLLEKVAAAVDQSAFYSALWGSLLTSPAVRLPGITYVLAHLNRKLSMEDQLYIIGSDIELMVGPYMFAYLTSISLEPGTLSQTNTENHATNKVPIFINLTFSSRKVRGQNNQ